MSDPPSSFPPPQVPQPAPGWADPEYVTRAAEAAAAAGPIPVNPGSLSGDMMPVHWACDVCGRLPSRRLSVRRQTGMLYLRRTSTDSGRFCKDCGRAKLRKGIVHNLLFGWWGIFSFFVNFAALLDNWKESRWFREVGEPVGNPDHRPLKPGLPVWLRPQAYLVPAIIIGLSTAAIVKETAHTSVIALNTGDCIDLRSRTTIADATNAPCNGPHDAEVAGKIPPIPLTLDDASCNSANNAYFGSSAMPDGIAPLQIKNAIDTTCLVANSDGSKLVGSHRGAGR